MANTRKEALKFMREEFGTNLKNEDGTRMTKKQLNKAADGWVDYFNAMEKILEERAAADRAKRGNSAKTKRKIRA